MRWVSLRSVAASASSSRSSTVAGPFLSPRRAPGCSPASPGARSGPGLASQLVQTVQQGFTEAPAQPVGRHVEDLLQTLAGHYDVILIDTPSAQEASDAMVIGQRAGAIMGLLG